MPKSVVFISHITEEAKLAALIKDHIQKAFLNLIDVFVSSDGASIEPGERWLQGISSNLQRAEVMLVLCSKASVKRPWINFEAGAAWVKEINTVPICHTDMTPGGLPVPLSELQGINATNADSWRGVYAVLAKKLGSDVPKANFTRLVKEIQAFEVTYRKVLTAKAEANAPPAPAEPPVLSLREQACQAIEVGRNDQVVLVRRFMTWLVAQLNDLNPDFSQNVEPDELLMGAITQSVPLVIDFARLSESVALAGSEEVARQMYRSFEHILAGYDRRPGDGPHNPVDYDFFKYIGHELFVIFCSFLVREERLQFLSDLLREGFHLNNGLNAKQRSVSFDWLAADVQLLQHRKLRLKEPWASPHGQLLAVRYEAREFVEVVPLQQFMDADLFLFLYSNGDDRESDWSPWSTINLHLLPRYLVGLERKWAAERLLAPLRIQGLDTLRRRLAMRKEEQRRFLGSLSHRNAFQSFDVNAIGKS